MTDWRGYCHASGMIEQDLYSTKRRQARVARDPVCGMEVDEEKAPAKTEYKGQTTVSALRDGRCPAKGILKGI